MQKYERINKYHNEISVSMKSLIILSPFIIYVVATTISFSIFYQLITQDLSQKS